MADDVRFNVKIDADADSAAEAALELDRLKSALQKSQSAIAAYRTQMATLKGPTDQVKAAKAKLTEAIAKEKAAMKNSTEASKAALSLLKLADAEKKLLGAGEKAKKSQDGLKKSISAIGGPAKVVRDKLDSLKDILGGTTSGWGAMAVGAAAAAVVLAAAIAVIAGLAVKLTDFVVTSGDSLRNLRLMREAVSGNTENATAWGHQIDWLSLKLATSKDDLNAMVVALEKSLRGTRVSGQGMVDTFTAVATASEAMGKDTGKALEDILTRGKLTGRFWLGFKAPGISELQGTGITYEQVAAQLAKNLGRGTAAVRQALQRGSITMDQGAKAVREVVEGRFADINAKKLISLGGLWTKFSDNIRDFASDAAQEGGALEPLLQGLKQVVDMFGLQSESGQNTKKVVTDYARALSDAFTRNLPLIKETVATGLKIAGWLVDATSGALRFAESDTGMGVIKTTLVAIAIVVGLLVAGLGVLGAVGFAAIYPIVKAFEGLWAAGKALVDLDWAGIGHAIVDGIKNGLSAAWEGLKHAVVSMGTGIRDEFKSILGIHSPSTVFRELGMQTGAGFQVGVEASQPALRASTASMAEAAVSGPVTAAGGAGAAGAAGGGAKIEINFTISGKDATEIKAELQSDSFLGQLASTVRAALKAGGVPTGAPAASGG